MYLLLFIEGGDGIDIYSIITCQRKPQKRKQKTKRKQKRKQNSLTY
jgi:hypothetical protein